MTTVINPQRILRIVDFADGKQVEEDTEDQGCELKVAGCGLDIWLCHFEAGSRNLVTRRPDWWSKIAKKFTVSLPGVEGVGWIWLDLV